MFCVNAKHIEKKTDDMNIEKMNQFLLNAKQPNKRTQRKTKDEKLVAVYTQFIPFCNLNTRIERQRDMYTIKSRVFFLFILLLNSNIM